MKLSKEIIMAAQKKWHRDYLMKNTIKYPAVSYRVPRKQELTRKLRNELQSLQRDLERAEEGLSDACRSQIQPRKGTSHPFSMPGFQTM